MSFLDSQKTQSVVGIANLAQNKKINKSLQELKKSQEQAAKNAKIQADLQKEANNLEKQRLSAQQDAARSAQMQLRIQEQAEQSRKQAEQRRKLKQEQEEREKQLLKIKKQTIFDARQDVKAIMKAENNLIEKFFDLNSIAFSLKDSNITAHDFDDYDDKEYLAQTESEISQAIDDTHTSMNEEEISDLQSINKVLSVNEESIISKIEKKIKKQTEIIKDIDISLEDIEKEISLSALESILEKYKK
jgi:multidrug efflux pump subunit AcrA (membrane-fusion protein)